MSSSASEAPPAWSDRSNSAAVARLQHYLRMRTDHPDPTPGYRLAVSWLHEFTAAYPVFTPHVVEISPGHPCVLLVWRGRDEASSSVLLCNHMDVVPAEEDKWVAAMPWAGSLIGSKVYGRGAQDMKSVGMGYLEACARLASRGYAPARTLVLAFVPDEEVGGGRGMKLLLAHELLRTLRPAVALDEGLASPDGKFSVFFGERKIWWLKVRAEGPAGHGSRFIEGAATARLLRVANAVSAHHEAQRDALAAATAACGCAGAAAGVPVSAAASTLPPLTGPNAGRQMDLGDCTTMNLTFLRAGIQDRAQYNVVPTVAEAGFDCRIPCTEDLAALEAKVAGWCAEAGASYEFMAGTDTGKHEHSQSDVSPDSYWWRRFQAGAAAAGAPLHAPSIFSAATDSRWVRMLLGIPCFGFSPMRSTPILLHDHDEFIGVDTFLEGISIYEKLIVALCESKGAEDEDAPPPTV